MYKGTLSAPSGQRIDIIWYRTGLEEYYVDGVKVLNSREFKSKGVRDFYAGKHRVRIRFSLFNMTCKAYIDEKPVVRDVFSEFRAERHKRRQVAHEKISIKEKIVINVLIFVVVFVLVSWLISLAA